MKKYFLISCVFASLLLTSCGSNASSENKTESTPTVTAEASEDTSVAEDESAAEEDSVDSSRADSGTENSGSAATVLFPDSPGFADVEMGVGDTTVSISCPLDYVLTGGYMDENGEIQKSESLDSASTTVQDSLDAGYLDLEHPLGYAVLSSINGDNTMITSQFYNDMSWDEFLSYYPDAVSFGDDTHPAVYYHVEAFSGESEAIAVKVDDIILQIACEGDLEENLGTETLAQELYDWVTF